MDKSEARTVRAQHLAIYRQYCYGDLTKLVGNNSVLEVCGPSGAEYQIEIEVMWDSPRDKLDIRVMGTIDEDVFPEPCFHCAILSYWPLMENSWESRLYRLTP